MKLSINNNIINKGDPRTKGWQNAEFDLTGLICHVTHNGLAWSPGVLLNPNLYKKPSVSDIAGAELLGIDIDNSVRSYDQKSGKYIIRQKTLTEGYLSIDSAQTDPWLISNALFLYSTPSHLPQWHRFRILFLLPEFITDPDEYSRIASAFIAKFDSDKSCKNIDRFFFGSQSAIVTFFQSDPISNESLNSVLNSIEEEQLTITEYEKSVYNDDLSESQVAELLSYIDGDRLSYDEWFRILSAVGNYFDENTAIRLIDSWSPDKDVGTAYKIKHRASKPGIGSVIYFAKRNGFNFASFKNSKSHSLVTPEGVLTSVNIPFPRDCIFWYEQVIGVRSPTYQLQISKSNFINFLMYHGIYKYWLDESTSVFVKVENFIVTEINIEKIVDIVKSLISQLPNSISDNFSNNDLWEVFLQKLKFFISKEYLSTLKSLDLPFITDTQKCSYVFFNNCFVVVSKDSVLVKKYSDLSGYIWKEQIINFNFSLIPAEQSFDTNSCIFGKFSELICSTANPDDPKNRKARVVDEGRLNSLLSSYGYLLHTYKDPSLTKAVIFCEERIAMSDESNGRSGKGLTAQAISKLRKRVVFNGKSIDFSDRFLFQRVTADAQLLYFDDIKSGFDFESLFSILTEGLTVERKGQKSVDIPFSKTPKILISTNSVLSNDSDSHRARKFEIEFSDYFNADYTPLDEFGELLFEQGWSNDNPEWNKFFSFMIYCIQFYLINGLVSYSQKNLNERKLLSLLPEEFVEFINELIPDFLSGNKYFKDEIYNKFTESYKIFGPNGKKAVSQKVTTKWFNTFLKLRNIEYVEERASLRSDRRYFWRCTAKQ